MGEFSIKRNVFTLKERKNADFQDGMHILHCMRWIESTMIIKFLYLTQCDSNVQNGWMLGTS